MDSEQTVYGWVAGRVQGVAFRASMKRQADQLGLRGWVRNLADGRVEFTAQGSATGIEQLLSWARQGPRFARVDDLHNESAAPFDDSGFEIRY